MTLIKMTILLFYLKSKLFLIVIVSAEYKNGVKNIYAVVFIENNEKIREEELNPIW